MLSKGAPCSGMGRGCGSEEDLWSGPGPTLREACGVLTLLASWACPAERADSQQGRQMPTQSGTMWGTMWGMCLNGGTTMELCGELKFHPLAHSVFC